MYGFKEGEDVFILEGKNYTTIASFTKEHAEVVEPNTIDLVNFASDDRFGK